MSTYWRLLGFAKPIEKYAIPYFFYTLFYSLFNTFNFVMIIPILNSLFDPSKQIAHVTEWPHFALNMEYFDQLLNFVLYKIYGDNYSVMNVMLFLSIFIVTSALLSNLFRYLGQWTIENMKIHTLRRLRNAVFDNVMGLHVGYFSNERKGDIISKITSDVTVVQFCITNTLQVAFREPFLIIGYMVALVKISWELTIFSAVFLPLTALLIGSIVKRLRKSAKEAQENFGDMTSLLDEALTGVKVIKGYNATGYITGKFRRINDLYSRITRAMARRQQLASPMSEFLGIAAAAVLLMYGGSLVLDGKLEAAGFIAYLAIFTQITRPVRSFTDAFSNINQGIAAGERVLGLLDEKSKITAPANAAKLEEFKDSIEFRNVSFSYPGTCVKAVDGIDFRLPAGKTYALVGESGGGKTTIARLIPRFWEADEGHILIGGVDVRDILPQELMDNVSFVFQQTRLFKTSLLENIRYGRPEASLEEVERAVDAAQCREIIDRLPDGLDTRIGTEGTWLSGGEQQRIALARAILKNAPIIVLDEATAFADPENEHLIQQALHRLTKGKTVLMIAHRLSSVTDVDRILVIDKGKIAEQGTHAELINQSGIYSRMWNEYRRSVNWTLGKKETEYA